MPAVKHNSEHQESCYQYLKGCLDRIDTLCSSEHNGECRVFKKVLLYSFIEGLAKSAARETRHIYKMQQLVTELGKWHDAERVSLPHLCKWLDLKPDSMPQKHITQYKAMLDQWGDGELRTSADDPRREDVKRHICKNANDLRNITHAGLLSHQRNCLVHEFMHNGVNLESPEDDIPSYMLIGSLSLDPGSRLTPQKQTWQLFYPTGFLMRLARQCLEGAKRHWIENDIDPRKYYSLGNYLWPELNSRTQASC